MISLVVASLVCLAVAVGLILLVRKLNSSHSVVVKDSVAVVEKVADVVDPSSVPPSSSSLS